MRRLTVKQAAFRDAMLAGYNPSVAYRKAYGAQNMSPRAITAEAQKLLKHPLISQSLSLSSSLSSQNTVVLPEPSSVAFVTRQRRMEELAYAALFDPIEIFDDLNHIKPINQMPEHVRRAIASFEVDPVSFVTKIKFVDKLSAIAGYSKLAGDIPKELPDGAEKKRQFDLSKLTDEELRLHMQLRKKAMVEA